MGTYTLPDLPYPYDALEPHIDEQTMRIHHAKHHQTYLDRLNAAIEGHDDLATGEPIENILRNLDRVPDGIKNVVRGNAGGHFNHSLFWTVMGPNGGGDPEGALRSAVERSFVSYKQFREQFTLAATSHFGSGWTWLVVAGGVRRLPTAKNLAIVSLPNQDSPIMAGVTQMDLMAGNTPILGIDLWEHAYYLKYQNRRPEYVEAFFNVINWEEVGRRYGAAG